jgi:K+-transporting ATPase KdpF subunit
MTVRSASGEEAIRGGCTMNLEYVVMGTVSLLVLIYLLVALLRPELF